MSKAKQKTSKGGSASKSKAASARAKSGAKVAVKKTVSRSKAASSTKSKKTSAVKKKTTPKTKSGSSSATAGSGARVKKKTAVTVKKGAETKRGATETKSVRKKVAVKKRTTADQPVTQTIPPEYLSPSKKLLKPFREAAKKNKEREKSKAARSKTNGFLAKPPKRGRKYLVDLRVHSPGTKGYLSTSGVDAGPALVRLAKVKGLDVMAVTDFYNASQIDSVQEAALKAKVTIVPGFDLRCRVNSCSEVFLTALFPEHCGSNELFSVLSQLNVPREKLGDRNYCLPLELSQIIAIIEGNEGIVIPSRLDKTPYRRLAIPTLVEEFGFHAFDLVYPDNPSYFKSQWPDGGFTFFAFSNANALGQIGSRAMKLKLPSSGFEGIKQLVERRQV